MALTDMTCADNSEVDGSCFQWMDDYVRQKYFFLKSKRRLVVTNRAVENQVAEIEDEAPRFFLEFVVVHR